MTAKERLEKFFDSDPIFAKKALGQNFLISDSAIQKMLSAFSFKDFQKIVEIGPGPGALTDYLCQFDLPLILLELDRVFSEYWRAKNKSFIEVHNCDALQWNWKQIENPENSLLISNLPYQISSSIVIDRSMDEIPFGLMILMFQKEVAQKIRAPYKTSEYGLLSVVAQTFWEIMNVCDLGSKDFIPAPKVASRVLKFKPTGIKINNKSKYLNFCKAAFKQKRKFLKSNLLQFSNLSEESIKQAFMQLDILSTVRAEELKISQFIDLYNILSSL